MRFAFAVAVFFFSLDARAECSTSPKLNDESDYVACLVTVDGQTKEQAIPDSACAAFCDLQKAQNQVKTYEEFSHFQAITQKPGQRKPAAEPAPPPATPAQAPPSE